MESALSGKFTTTGTKTLKAGTTDSTFSVLQLLQAGAAGSAMLEAASGAMVSKMTVTTKFGDEANISFDVLATSQSQVTTDSTLALTTVPAGAFEFAGKDVATITVAGNSMFLDYVLRIPYKGDTLDIRVDDRMYLVNPNVLINESRMIKFGFEVGEILLVIERRPQES